MTRNFDSDPLGDLGRRIREQVEETVRKATERAATVTDRAEERSSGGVTSVAIASSVGGAGHTTTVYSDDDVTIVTRDGERHVIRHGAEPGQEGSSPGGRAD